MEAILKMVSMQKAAVNAIYIDTIFETASSWTKGSSLSRTIFRDIELFAVLAAIFLYRQRLHIRLEIMNIREHLFFFIVLEL